MYLVKIGSKCGNEPTILIDGGIHAREWISPAVVLYFIQQLVENRKNQHMIEHVNWYIIPLLNPDGYEYTHQGGKKRLWRLNRAPVKGGSCYGTDLNRNFDFHWNEVGTSQKLCANTFPGLSPFDQLETTALRNVVMQYKDQIKLYLSFHSYARMIVYPWSYTKELPNNAKELQYLGEKVAARISKVRGTKYTVNMSTHILPFTSGSSDDWVKGVGGVELAYTIELPEGKGGGGFILPPSDILDICVETFEGIKTFHNYIANKCKLYELNLESNHHQDIITSLTTNKLFDFWSMPNKLGLPVTVMVYAEAQAEFLNTLTVEKIPYKVLIEDVEDAVKSERRHQNRFQNRRRGQITFENYNRYTEIESYVQRLANDYPDILNLEQFQTTYEGRAMWLLKIGVGSQSKPTILIDGDPTIAHFWRLNPAPISSSNCNGIDLNRNFDFHWGEIGSSSEPCSPGFRGRYAFDQVETRSLRDIVNKYRNQIKLYLTFHSAAQMILYPWSYTQVPPENAPELQSLGEQVATAIASVKGTLYNVNNSVNLLSFSTGSSYDWVKGVGGVELSYTFELPKNRFDLSPSEIFDPSTTYSLFTPNSDCNGTDLNRNFDFHWRGPGSSPVPCDETFRGRYAFDQLETRGLQDVVNKHRNQIKLYLTFHSAAQMIIYSWGYTKQLPENASELQSLGEQVAAAIATVKGTLYGVNTTVNLLTFAAGISIDWVKRAGGVELSFTVELPNHRFDLPPSEIFGVCVEMFEGDRFWRLNRAPVTDSDCIGTDLNRNFDFHWGGPGSSPVPCNPTFRGRYAFDQLETGGLRDIVNKYKNQIKLYLTFHSAAQVIIYPWGYSNELPEDAPELQSLGEQVAAAISSVNGTLYSVSNTASLLPFGAGGSDDWVKGAGGVELSYTFELPKKRFDLPPSDIIGICVETFQGVEVYHNYIENKFKNL
ncbi:hypothetical protein Trydic_g951 [Trypoxylus dichotomus]